MTSKNSHKKTFFKIHRDVLICLFLIMATLGVYWHVTNHEFINYDDDLYVTDNHNVQAGLRLESITWSFTATHASNWHPLTWMSHMLDCQLFGMNPGWHHLTNLFFHIANALLLFLAFKRMTGDSWQSGFVAALFALHPLHVESVAWVAERKDVLSAFFWMLTVWSYIWYLERPRVSRYLRVLFFFILGLMAKPMLVTLPFVLLLLDYWPLGRFQFGRSGGEGKSRQRAIALRLVWEKIPLFILAVASSFVTFLVQQSGGAVRSLDALSLDVRISNTLVSYVSYIGKMIWPYHLAVLYPHPGNLPMSQIAVACLLLISISFLAIMAVRQRPYFAVGWLWYIGTLVPVIGLVQVGIQSFADRYTYVPLIGIFIIIAWGFPDIVSKCRHKEIGITIIVGALLSIFMVTTWLQVRYWNNNMTLFEHALDVTANNYLAHNNLGNALKEQGDRAEAIRHYSEALRIKPNYAKVHNNLGNALVAQGKLKEAIKHYSEAVSLDHDFAEAYNNLGAALFRTGKIEEAIAHFQEALRTKPNDPNTSNNLKMALAAKRGVDEAIAETKEKLRLNPEDPALHYKLGELYNSKGELH
ncbi:MAG: tetratricopeptide repeat protein, partial [Desulfobacterales bacterium]|nr:tetratricopeptide repeat protein [Desulfobacterales bacterium]